MKSSVKSFYGDTVKCRELTLGPKCDPRIDLKQRQTSLLSPSRTWKVFDRQEDALKFCKKRGNGLMTFVFHAKSTLQRQFLVAHPREFWLHDILKPKSERNSYEIIPEFEPCKLYLDLEYEFEFNPNSDGIKMIEIFIKVIAYKLFNLYHITVNRNLILDLDSTTDIKFSRHLIYQIPFISFANNYQVGIFITEICTLIRNLDEDLCKNAGVSIEELKLLFIKDRNGKDKLFCDEGVYTKNRHFRLYGSTKPNKNSHLVLSAQNSYTVHFEDSKLQEEAIFLASLVTNFEPLDVLVSLPELKSDLLKIKYPNSSSNSNGQSGNFPSPFPVLDTFIKSEIMCKEGVRCWMHFPDSNCIVYKSLHPPFCYNIGREHKSNGGMLIVDLHKNHYYRKCFDFDCTGFQTMPQALPSYVVTSLQNPECTEQEKKEIKDLLEFLENHDDSMLFDDENTETQVHSPGSQLALDLDNLTVQSQYADEIQDTLSFLTQCPEF